MDDYVFFSFVVSRLTRVGGRQRYYHTVELLLPA
ncbi:hypothetical protein F383_31851 [Gossypium arboreum]|uniref:Uncharacterized protein n=1 Tax=Gossypium arboreum TaxID=29729 RepID=A0A0B0PQ79_GOSAR|nr:hypothetical protein F383_31851 [Gossypium arboreum]